MAKRKKILLTKRLAAFEALPKPERRKIVKKAWRELHAEFKPLPPGEKIAKDKDAWAKLHVDPKYVPQAKRKKIEKVEAAAVRKTKIASAKLERDAHYFAPDLMLSIAIDYKHQRIMVKTVEGLPPSPASLIRFEAAAKQEMLTGRMLRGWGIGRDCDHPKWRRRKMRYVTGTELGIECFKLAEFCCGCGKIMSHVEEEFKVTVGELIEAKLEARFPNVRRTA